MNGWMVSMNGIIDGWMDETHESNNKWINGYDE